MSTITSHPWQATYSQHRGYYRNVQPIFSPVKFPAGSFRLKGSHKRSHNLEFFPPSCRTLSKLERIQRVTESEERIPDARFHLKVIGPKSSMQDTSFCRDEINHFLDDLFSLDLGPDTRPGRSPIVFLKHDFVAGSISSGNVLRVEFQLQSGPLTGSRSLDSIVEGFSSRMFHRQGNALIERSLTPYGLLGIRPLSNQFQTSWAQGSCNLSIESSLPLERLNSTYVDGYIQRWVQALGSTILLGIQLGTVLSGIPLNPIISMGHVGLRATFSMVPKMDRTSRIQQTHGINHESRTRGLSRTLTQIDLVISHLQELSAGPPQLEKDSELCTAIDGLLDRVAKDITLNKTQFDLSAKLRNDATADCLTTGLSKAGAVAQLTGPLEFATSISSIWRIMATILGTASYCAILGYNSPQRQRLQHSMDDCKRVHSILVNTREISLKTRAYIRRRNISDFGLKKPVVLRIQKGGEVDIRISSSGTEPEPSMGPQYALGQLEAERLELSKFV